MRLTASVGGVGGGFAETKSLKFIEAHPSKIVVDLDKTTLKANTTDSALITVHLLRVGGVVTDGIAIDYQALDPRDGTDLNFLFRDPIVSKDGKATAKVTAGNTQYRGPAKIRATFSGTDVDGQPVVVFGEETIEIVP